ncbi:5-methyltetrahydropteroyltriglutamate--homocysteine S-methyltransferase [Buchnera aphidicola]|uniref:5-methyltetrahydropteroyltriglutamate-- homocysteine S-methyltransferase n=1 Tax=Buchnera aphidicola TaxID=9 RepID=UPI00223869EC|nr:5-methyltetrahydropteroyltriglutamate--homocysteine S-methyltransferase [Buchnera aphidicola]MCW5197399.1 5-methyltetrahydropteroyltriglutamate--homocysteine S-methyltransferase [Buchnera aphidicola (Chaitophorus viminalis)]
MTILNHILGFPRIGFKRELKIAQEMYWSKKISKSKLKEIGKKIRIKNLKKQKEMGLDFLSVGDFAWYDHVLSTSMMLGNIPKRFINSNNKIDIDTLFYIARGVSTDKKSTNPSEMTKWFNTNYHYIVPEFSKDSVFNFSWKQLLKEIDEALLIGKNVKPIILGPMSYLWLGKTYELNFNRFDLLDKILDVYKNIFSCLEKKGIKWIQIDEPILSLDLSSEYKKNFIYSYNYLKCNINILLTTYFGNISHNLDIIQKIPIQGIHLDLISGKYNFADLKKNFSKDLIISLGVINGKNIWKTDLIKYYFLIKKILKYRDNIWIGSSCSLIHVPVDIQQEKKIKTELKTLFSFAVQKCYELYLLSSALNKNKIDLLESWVLPLLSYNQIIKNNTNNNLKDKILSLKKKDYQRKNSYKIRYKKQKKKLNLPILPITTIGSFPQTQDLRKLRSNFRNKLINKKEYKKKIFKIIKYNILQQEKLNIDVLVHGEPERNDMVEYFGENLEGFLFTEYGWVQSYGSRCVKPPIIYSDISRSKPITLDWIKYAQSLTKKPVKGMLTGPVTILLWSFPREDISYKIIATQIALALKDEIYDLEKNGINIIQIDEPALREGLPLKNIDKQKYLSWAINSFKLSVSSVKDSTQIHTHMCYCEFNDIIQSISDLDADVITIETARSNMEILDCFKNFKYPNSVGPGFYDIHSPNIPQKNNIIKLIKKSMKIISINKLWINPDCGLKTRTWTEVNNALKNLVSATKKIRSNIS